MTGSEKINRIDPTRQPSGQAVMRQGWARLLFLHWIVPSEALAPLLPSGLTLDTYEGSAYVGLVPFTMKGVRPAWSPSYRPLSDFHETNVRTYVHRKGRDPGVWFFSLDAANAAAVRLARAWYRLPYHFARMRLEDRDGEVHYQSERLWPGPVPAGCRVRYRKTGTPHPAAPGTLEHFLVERYILYSTSGSRLFSGRVHHQPYPVQSAVLEDLDENLIQAAGIARPDTEPLIHYAEEVSVRVYGLRRVER